MDTSSARQAEHYDRILSDYDRHYYDRLSLEYRERFILGPLLEDVDLSGQRVADLGCGSGETSLALIERFARIEVTGFDISPEACRRYRDKVGRRCHELDLTRGYGGIEPFDAAIVMGALHHCVSDLPGALSTVAGMLRPGGLLLMFEPNRDYALEFARRIWYRLDRYFDAETEAALSHDKLLQQTAGNFQARKVIYFGGPAFYLVYNSLVFRLPTGLKNAMGRPLLAVEHAFNKLPGRWPFASFLAQWIRAG
jgi:SAM-dependent methyltransferase